MSKFTEKRDEVEAKAESFFKAWLSGFKASPSQHGFSIALGGFAMLAVVLVRLLTK